MLMVCVYACALGWLVYRSPAESDPAVGSESKNQEVHVTTCVSSNLNIWRSASRNLSAANTQTSSKSPHVLNIAVMKCCFIYAVRSLFLTTCRKLRGTDFINLLKLL